MRIESLVVLVLVGGSACGLLAPSDLDLSGGWGAGGVRELGDGGQTNGAGRRASGGNSGPDTGGGESTTDGGRTSGGVDTGGSGFDGSQGGAAPQAGMGNDGEGGATIGARGGAKSAGGTSSTGAGGTSAVAGSGGKSAAGGVSIGTGGSIIVANGGAVASSGGKLGAGGTGAGGTLTGAGGAGMGGAVTGAGGAVSHCASNPCARGTCSEITNGYKCTCPAGWGGTTCAVGSCSTLSCPSSAPCKEPSTSSFAAVCYPSACGTGTGLCMAQNADGTGDAVIIDGRNTNFNDLSGSINWGNHAKYFAYLEDAHGRYACVFPSTDEGGTPLVIPLNTVRTKSSGFGQSNSWPNPPTCSYP